jgi:hypothetical protein
MIRLFTVPSSSTVPLDMRVDENLEVNLKQLCKAQHLFLVPSTLGTSQTIRFSQILKLLNKISKGF